MKVCACGTGTCECAGFACMSCIRIFDQKKYGETAYTRRELVKVCACGICTCECAGFACMSYI